MSPGLIRKFRTLSFICMVSCLAGVIFQLVDEQRIDHNSFLMGFPLGLAFGVLELFLMPRMDKQLRNWSFTRILLFKTLLYTAVINTVLLSVTILVGMSQGRALTELGPYLASTGHLALIVYTLAIYGLLVFLLQINHLLGDGVLWKFLRGKYLQPREEERIFMFLDMKSSTAIAEKLGHEQFYALLNEVFHQISQPVLETKAEIYQYVGDEVVLTWEVGKGIENSNCLRSFFLFREQLHQNREGYLKRFGVQPEFKAGLHFGKVISAQIGDLKREIVYNGDVLNTTSRIQDQCNQFRCDCLVSGSLKDRLGEVNDFHWQKIGTVQLRGKEKDIELFSVGYKRNDRVFGERETTNDSVKAFDGGELI